ncbi:PREDICTED: DNA primase small subunit-like [Ceratosolen solmsi marchali]|uniref:DNA primase n=1 Tax=Ceratosolen solmsi marchali TaxID=326594 RepID=A0AAJ6YH04_9HYME|nr:PREDICTED: DNA primase small subunit-like [Ceratosolen solmsi marchali]
MDKNYLQDINSIYFSRLFPFNDLYRWLSYGEEKTFACREFALNFQGDRYLRNQSYQKICDLKRAIKINHPVKIDIGAVYNIPPAIYKVDSIFYSEQKELIFDIDATDYDEVRTCCSGADICPKCWKHMVIALKILDTALREDFGFDHILWVFSGRRGIHCWVCDRKARLLRGSGRIAIANYLQLVTGGNYKKKKVEIKERIHHSVKRALEIIEPVFVKMCVEEQNMLGTSDGIAKFLGIIDKEEMRTIVQRIFEQYSTSLTKWEAFVHFYRHQLQSESEDWSRTPFLIEEIMIQYAYPRLDINVSFGITHLLKSPFSVHPKTGKIGVVLNLETIEKFDPNNVPTVSKLMKEIDAFDVKMKKQGMSNHELKKVDDIEKTSLCEYVRIFHEFVDNLVYANKENVAA